MWAERGRTGGGSVFTPPLFPAFFRCLSVLSLPSLIKSTWGIERLRFTATPKKQETTVLYIQVVSLTELRSTEGFDGREENSSILPSSLRREVT